MRRLLHLLCRKDHHRTFLLTRTLLLLEERTHAIRVLVLFPIHHVTLVRVSVDPPHRPRNHHRTAIARCRSNKTTVLRDGMTRIKPVAAKPSELPRDVPPPLYCVEYGGLVVHLSRHHHADVDPLPEDVTGVAPLGENASAGDEHASCFAIRCRNVHVGFRKEMEKGRVGGRVTRKHMRIHDETVIEGEIRIVKNTRAPLLLCSP